MSGWLKQICNNTVVGRDESYAQGIDCEKLGKFQSGTKHRNKKSKWDNSKTEYHILLKRFIL